MTGRRPTKAGQFVKGSPHEPPYWKAWYSLARWHKLRAKQLRDEPLCRMHRQVGQTVAATICDHVTPHRGDEHLFWSGPFQSLCKTCHDSYKQAMEKSGRALQPVGIDGWPVSVRPYST